mmetsp:Transcript_19268/g.41387  ORF Transcript_19268/g.41387 Transcript_19268/m.41387 type:complete len:164 (+) Transcript_19268:378-869(+)
MRLGVLPWGNEIVRPGLLRLEQQMQCRDLLQGSNYDLCDAHVDAQTSSWDILVGVAHVDRWSCDLAPTRLLDRSVLQAQPKLPASLFTCKALLACPAPARGSGTSISRHARGPARSTLTTKTQQKKPRWQSQGPGQDTGIRKEVVFLAPCFAGTYECVTTFTR